MNAEFFSIRQSADYLGFNHHTIRRAIKKGDLKAYQIGKLWRIEKEDLEDWIYKNRKKLKNN